jgi:hypothetical protein
MILLPEVCANLCLGGEKRNRLFMAASQSIYAVYVGIQGAHITGRHRLKQSLPGNPNELRHERWPVL